MLSQVTFDLSQLVVKVLGVWVRGRVTRRRFPWKSRWKDQLAVSPELGALLRGYSCYSSAFRSLGSIREQTPGHLLAHPRTRSHSLGGVPESGWGEECLGLPLGLLTQISGWKMKTITTIINPLYYCLCERLWHFPPISPCCCLPPALIIWDFACLCSTWKQVILVYSNICEAINYKSCFVRFGQIYPLTSVCMKCSYR